MVVELAQPSLSNILEVIGQELAQKQCQFEADMQPLEMEESPEALVLLQEKYETLKQNFLTLERTKLFYLSLKDVPSREKELETQQQNDAMLHEIQSKFQHAFDHYEHLKCQMKAGQDELQQHLKAANELMQEMQRILKGREDMKMELSHLVDEKRIYQRKTPKELREEIEHLKVKRTHLETEQERLKQSLQEEQSQQRLLEKEIQESRTALEQKEAQVEETRLAVQSKSQQIELQTKWFQSQSDVLSSLLGAKLTVNESANLLQVECRPCDGIKMSVDLQLSPDDMRVQSISSLDAVYLGDLSERASEPDMTLSLLIQLVVDRCHTFGRRQAELNSLRQQGAVIVYDVKRYPHQMTLNYKGHSVELTLNSCYPRMLNPTQQSTQQSLPSAGCRMLRDFDLVSTNPSNDALFDLFENGKAQTVTDLIQLLDRS